jgi:glycosyltransferase involved in cell wall biosynthesis
MKIRFHGMLGTQHSWSFTQQYLARAMVKIGGHDIFLKSTNNLKHFPNDLREFLIPGYHGSLTQGEVDYIKESGEQVKVSPHIPLPEIADKNFPYDLELAYTIFYQSPRRFFQESRCRAVIWNFESSIIPDGWHLYHRAVDYFLPSSQYSYDIFANNGIPKDKMLVVPHGVDTNLFNPNIPPFKLKTEKKVKFLHNAIPHHRKLHERVIRAYLDTFTGNDDVCLVLKTKFLTPDKDKPFEIDVKKILEREYKKRKNPPEIEVVNTYIPNIGSLYTACDAVVSMSSCEGFCFIPGTEVDTMSGPKEIENITAGTEIISHTGKILKVTGTSNRKVNEEIIGIKRQGHYNIIWGTKNHPFFIVQTKNDPKTTEVNLRNNILKPKWVELQNISTKDYVVIPKPLFEYNEISSMKISDYVKDADITKNKIFYKNGFGRNKNKISYKTIANMSGVSENTVRAILGNWYKTKNSASVNKVKKVANQLKWKKQQQIMCNNIIEIDENLAKFFGLYISEGCSDGRNYATLLSSHKKEFLAREIEKEISDRFNASYKEKINNNTGIVVINGKVLTKFLTTLFGKDSHSKTIPKMFWNSNVIKYIMWGIFYGDGSLINNTYNFSTVSKKLANDIFEILLSKNILSYISHYKENNYNQYSISIARQFNKRFEEWIDPYKYLKKTKSTNINKPYYSSSTILETDDMFLAPISKISKRFYSGMVHNLHVEKDHSFTVNGTAVHNCLPLLEALACESLVIAPRHGGQLDFLNNNNSLLVDTGEMIAPKSMQYWTFHENAVVGDPNEKHFAELLRKVYENPKKEKERVKESAKKTVKEFTWEAAAQMILDLPIPKKSKRFYPKKKVLYIVPYNMAGGGEVWIKEAIRRLDRNIYEPHVALISGVNLSLAKIFDLKPHKKNKDVLINESDITFEILEHQGRGKALKCLIESENYSIIHFYNSFGVYNILREAWRQGLRCRIVETVHSDFNWSDSMLKVSTRENLVLLIMAVSNNMAKKLLKSGNKNVVVTPQHIDWNRFQIERSKDILEEFNISKNFVVGFVGRLSPEKNIPTLLQCAKALPNISFVIVGEGPQKSPLQQMAGQMKNVFFIGQVDNVEKFYAAFDVLMLPSLVEGLPLVLLEAMATGTPVITSDVGAISEIVNDGVNGFLVWNPSAHQLFAQNILKLTDKSLWNQCSNNCKVVAKAAYEKSLQQDINYFYNMLFCEGK